MIGEAGVSLIAFLGMLPLTLGLVMLVLTGNLPVKVHALSLAGVGPLLLLLSAPAWADGRMILTALILSAAMLLTTAISSHAIMRLIATRQNSEPGRKDGEPAPEAPDENEEG